MVKVAIPSVRGRVHSWVVPGMEGNAAQGDSGWTRLFLGTPRRSYRLDNQTREVLLCSTGQPGCRPAHERTKAHRNYKTSFVVAHTTVDATAQQLDMIMVPDQGNALLL